MVPALPALRGRRSLIVALGWFAAAGCILAVPALPHLDLVILGGVMVGVFIAYLTAQRRAGTFDFFDPFLPFSLIYFLYFPVGAIWCRENPARIASLSLLPHLAPAVAVAVLGYIVFTLGYLTLFRRVAPHPPLLPTRTACLWVPMGIGYAGQVASFLQGRSILGGGGVSPVLSAIQQLSPVFFLGWALAWYEYFGGRLSRMQKFHLVIVFIPMAVTVLALTIGGKSLAITILGLPAIAYWYTRRRLPWRSILVALLLLVFIIFPIYNNFRLQSRKLATGERLGKTIETAAEWDSNTFYTNSIESFMGRMAVVTSMAAVLRDVGTSVDFRRGDTLILLPISVFIPRVLWPDKPNIMTGREFGVTFQLVNSVDRETQIAPTVVADFYWNFHIPGVLVGMFLLGGCYRWCYQRYGASSGYDPIGKAIWLTLLVSLMAFEFNVAGLLAVLLKSLLIMVGLQWYLKSSGLAATPSTT